MEPTRDDSIRTITPRSLFEVYEEGKPVELIDVRTPAEYREVHATMARLAPLERLDPIALVGARTDGNETLYVICRTGARSKKACEAFAAAGFGDRVVNVEGGTLAWEKAGLPVVRGKKTISLERQLRIVAGGIVLGGVVLGAVVDPWFNLLAAIGGAGLIFAGVTDICPMAMVLARMPWNQAGGSSASCRP
ncbi:rhodanese-like domain-containing protein [Paludisphaera borealis]|uniref:Inner membrane protein YgaP n=1 Tax=Paludisphaera borealis TaxID=1387353 RepID=A0A1U7CZ14_9BACT|nr:rhodanese-like domain-containing protein [Paludisphaera borealis]APW64197.1 Inner membrane protein YgaP [Paludisphaera borealis]